MLKLASRSQFWNIKPNYGAISQNRNFWHWLNKIFNQVDPDRVLKVGPNGACAEWLLRNGAALRWVGATKMTNDYNNLIFGQAAPAIAEIDASNSSISHYGFEHLHGCKKIEKIVIHNCTYIEDEAVRNLRFVNSPLKRLQISSCLNITDQGLYSFPQLNSLEELVLSNLNSVKNMNECKKHIQNILPNCKILDTINE